uniref:Uncharacterized protein n=1 Tax=Solanum tuberosum TaxID=4113 RepID=M1DL72_SOLTU
MDCYHEATDGPSKGPRTVKWVVVAGQGLLVLATPLYGPLHGPCEPPRTMQATVVLHLRLGSTGSALRASPQSVLKTMTYEGLRGLMPEPWVLLPLFNEASHSSCGAPRPMKGSVVHHFWEGVNHEQVDGPWFLS